MYCGYLGGKHKRNMVSDISSLRFNVKQQMTPIQNGSTRFRYFSINEAKKQKQT